MYIYKDIWDPTVSKIVVYKHENRNPRDLYMVALQKDCITVGHFPHMILCICTLFSRHLDTLLGKPSLSVIPRLKIIIGL